MRACKEPLCIYVYDTEMLYLWMNNSSFSYFLSESDPASDAVAYDLSVPVPTLEGGLGRRRGRLLQASLYSYAVSFCQWSFWDSLALREVALTTRVELTFWDLLPVAKNVTF